MVYLRFVHLLAGKDQESLKSLRKIRRKEANGKILLNYTFFLPNGKRTTIILFYQKNS